MSSRALVAKKQDGFFFFFCVRIIIDDFIFSVAKRVVIPQRVRGRGAKGGNVNNFSAIYSLNIHSLSTGGPCARLYRARPFCTFADLLLIPSDGGRI